MGNGESCFAQRQEDYKEQYRDAVNALNRIKELLSDDRAYHVYCEQKFHGAVKNDQGQMTFKELADLVTGYNQDVRIKDDSVLRQTDTLLGRQRERSGPTNGVSRPEFRQFMREFFATVLPAVQRKVTSLAGALDQAVTPALTPQSSVFRRHSDGGRFPNGSLEAEERLPLRPNGASTQRDELSRSAFSTAALNQKDLSPPSGHLLPNPQPTRTVGGYHGAGRGATLERPVLAPATWSGLGNRLRPRGSAADQGGTGTSPGAHDRDLSPSALPNKPKGSKVVTRPPAVTQSMRVLPVTRGPATRPATTGAFSAVKAAPGGFRDDPPEAAAEVRRMEAALVGRGFPVEVARQSGEIERKYLALSQDQAHLKLSDALEQSSHYFTLATTNSIEVGPASADVCLIAPAQRGRALAIRFGQEGALCLVLASATERDRFSVALSNITGMTVRK
mmetsp:Transcript_17469/g.40064  ORF Transcript_17469/g.40064 Transcript_17469/m.40064 type:complete len:448 (-) Transcript_17469:72-1415(-)